MHNLQNKKIWKFSQNITKPDKAHLKDEIRGYAQEIRVW